LGTFKADDLKTKQKLIEHTLGLLKARVSSYNTFFVIDSCLEFGGLKDVAEVSDTFSELLL